MEKFINKSDGREYKVLEACPYSDLDLDYYKEDKNRLYAYALLQDTDFGSYVVACGLNKRDWNEGIYYFTEDASLNLIGARACYNEKVAEYLGEPYRSF